MYSFFLFFSLFFINHSLFLSSNEISTSKLKTLYSSLDPTSISQHLAFYDLYPYSIEGQQSLKDAYYLLSGQQGTASRPLSLPLSLINSLNGIVGLINKHPNESQVDLSDSDLQTIEKLASRLPNRKLAGYGAKTEEAILKLNADQIDVTRAILITQLGESEEAIRKIRSYEAAIDLMALQILTRLSFEDSPAVKIRIINDYIFNELGFRFPPHSTYAKDIDLYTFLPSVLDSRRGVCLGVSILYLSLSQRLNLNLEIVTPPGHIFVRWRKEDEIINIETTARGINLPSEEYLGVNTRLLKERDIKETIGMAHFNQASVYWEQKKHDLAMATYIKAQRYLPNERFVTELMGYTAILQGDEEKGKQLLEDVLDYIPEDAVSKHTIGEDIISKNASADGIRAVFLTVDEDRESLNKKRIALEEVLKIHPRFREGLFSLAGTWLQLYRSKEALETLMIYHSIDSNNATVEYYLSALHAERLDYNQAWEHLLIAEKIIKQRNHSPLALKELRQELSECCPEWKNIP